jgi:hypothetical protein
MMRLLLLTIFAATILSACSQSEHLVKDGKSDYKIFVSDKATAPEKHAAEELQTYLQKVSGCKMEITHEQANGEKLVYIGFKDAPTTITGNLNPAEFGNEEYIIRSDGKNLLIAGGETRGTLYGVMGYLTDYVGCRWYTRDVAKIPNNPTLSLAKIEDRQKPALQYRDMDWRESLDATWVIHNRLNGFKVGDSLGGNYVTFPFVHTFNQLVPPEKYFKTHPEYFSLVNGKRTTAQLCLTNPEMVKTAIATVFDWIKTRPEVNVFSIDQNDFGGRCECQFCSALDEKEGSPSGSLLTFVNQIADTVSKAYPKIRLQTLAYDYTVDPPKNIRPADNVIIRLCHYDYCAAHPLEGCIKNKPFLDQLNQWKKITKAGITIWDYYTNFQNYLMPYPNFASFSHDVKFYADNGVMGLFAEGNANGGAGEFAELRSWVIAQLMWNPHQDAAKLVDEYVDNVYGKAAKHIASYIKLLHDQVKPDTHFGIWPEPFNVTYLNQSTIQKADSIFALAQKSAEGDTSLAARIDLDYLPILYTKLYYFAQGGTAYISKEELPAALSRYNNFVSKYHITALGADVNTFGNMDKFIEKIKIADNATFYTDWLLSGPFDNTDQKGHDKVYPPEQGFDSTQTFEGANGQKLNWKKYQDKTTGYIDLNKVYGQSENVVAFARRTITLPEEKIMKFGVGNNDGIKVWINGKLAFDLTGANSGPNQRFFTTTLNKGENTILIKVDQLKRGWGFYFASH